MQFDSKDVLSAFAALSSLENTQGTNAKKAIIEAHAGNIALRDIVFAAYGGDVFNAYPTLEFADSPTELQPELSDRAARELGAFFDVLASLSSRKVTGNTAVALLDDTLRSSLPVCAKWFRRIVEHDLKIGCNKRTFSKVWDFKSLVLGGTASDDAASFIFPGVMLCESGERHVNKWNVDKLVVEPKYDGLRLMFAWDGKGNSSFFSRQGKSERYNENLAHISAALLRAISECGLSSSPGAIDGEIMGDSWNSTLAIKRKDVSSEDRAQIEREIKFYAFDHLIGTGDTRGQLERRLSLESIVQAARSDSIVAVPYYICASLADAMVKFKEAVSAKYEGVIIKHPDAKYVANNKRSRQWVKIKPIDTQDVRITGWFSGRERTKLDGKFGGFNVENDAGQTFKVGGGFSDDERERIMTKGPDSCIGKWIEIEYQKDDVAAGRFPVFVRWRDDLVA